MKAGAFEIVKDYTSVIRAADLKPRSK